MQRDGHQVYDPHPPAVAEHERDMISDRTRKALAAAKAASKQIGNPNIGERNGKAAAMRAKHLRPIMAKLADLSTQAAANNVNRRGITTATGGQWHAVQVYRVRQRLGLF
jgi:DNA invertase Pin-like site-specific DNA recombinase